MPGFDFAGRTPKPSPPARRVEKIFGGSVVKIYWYGGGSIPLDETDGSGSTTNSTFSEYVFFAGARIARRDASGDVFYYVADHLGSARAIAEVASGQNTATLCYDADFYPFGGEMPFTDSCQQNYKFTGKERDAESGLDNFGARYDSSSFGRFMTPDWAASPTAVPYAAFGDPQTLNLYAYAVNAPVDRADSDGHCLIDFNCISTVYDTVPTSKNDNTTTTICSGPRCPSPSTSGATVTPDQQTNTQQAQQQIIIDYNDKTSSGTLRLVSGSGKNQKVLLTASVVVGGPGHHTPTGHFHASYWEKDHTSTKFGRWAKTPWSKSALGLNVFGPYQLHIKELESRGIYIHGTLGPSWNPSTFGNGVVGTTSHGCVRMCNPDDIELHTLLPHPAGVPITITAGGDQ